MVEQAFILAAGKGERLRPYTEKTPKPLVCVKGRPILLHMLEAMRHIPTLKRVVINTSYLAEQIQSFVQAQSHNFPFQCITTFEPEALETGGGLVFAKAHLQKEKPLLCVSGDFVWDPTQPLLQHFCAGYAKTQAPFFISLQPVAECANSTGDYFFENNTPKRAVQKNGTHFFTSLRVMDPSLFWDRKAEKWGQLELMDACEANGTLKAMQVSGMRHISTAQDLELLNEQ